MHVVFRTDASIQIGTGHVMRCLTLADALTDKGAKCEFICRQHLGNLIKDIRNKNYTVHILEIEEDRDAELAHSKWLGATQAQDVTACELILANCHPDWIVVDHYALDRKWESVMAEYCSQLMVIDDLADRVHECQILIDQTYGRNEADYSHLIPRDCKILCGSIYAMLRPEFAALRSYSLNRRLEPSLKRILVSMGGVDKANTTTRVLNNLRITRLPVDCEVIVVMGPTSPWLSEVEQIARTLPWSTSVYVGVSNMAQLLAESDLAIASLGVSTWERATLGLPSFVKAIAENQTYVAERICSLGAAIPLDEDNLFAQINALRSDTLIALSNNNSMLSDGLGIERVMKEVFL